MCDCFRIGGPFIAEDPDCPEHGTEARRAKTDRALRIKFLRQDIQHASSISDLKRCLDNALDLLDED